MNTRVKYGDGLAVNTINLNNLLTPSSWALAYIFINNYIPQVIMISYMVKKGYYITREFMVDQNVRKEFSRFIYGIDRMRVSFLTD